MLTTEQIRALAQAYAYLDRALEGNETERHNAMCWPLKGVTIATKKASDLGYLSDELNRKLAELYSVVPVEAMDEHFNTHLNLEQQGVWQLAYLRTAHNTDATKIEQRRKEHGLTRVDLAKASGIPVRTISDWEARRRSPRNFDKLGKLAEVLNCTVADLLEY